MTARAPPRRAPRVLVVAGLDPSGGAGLTADAEALAAVGARALPVATALTFQGAGGATGFEPVRPALLAAQIEALLAGRGPDAVKCGMLGTGANAAALARLLAPLRGRPLVLDPVLAASSGLPLLRGARAPRALLAPLLEVATLVTPNRPELEALAGLAPGALRSDDEAVDAARLLSCAAVLVKGGHRRGAPVDLLVRPGGVRRFAGRRRRGSARGTGCRLASAIAGLLARGERLEDAVRGAKRVVERYLDDAARR